MNVTIESRKPISMPNSWTAKQYVPDALILHVREYLKTHSLGNRGVEDGSKKNQEVGLIGEMMAYQFLTGQWQYLNAKKDGFDGGYDILFQGKKIDVKTMCRNVYVQMGYVNNFYLMQQHYQADTLIFCSYNQKAQVVEICGWIPKSELKTKGKFYAAGTTRERADGTSFVFRQVNFEVGMSELYDIKNWGADS